MMTAVDTEDEDTVQVNNATEAVARLAGAGKSGSSYRSRGKILLLTSQSDNVAMVSFFCQNDLHSNTNMQQLQQFCLWFCFCSIVGGFNKPAIKESYHCPHQSISLWLLWRIHLEFATRKYWITHNWHAIWMILYKTSLFPGSTSLLDWSNFRSVHKPRALLNASRVLIIECLPCCVYVGVFSSTTNNRLCSKIPDNAWPTSARTSGS